MGIAGGTQIGKHCMIGGNVGIADQLEICDGMTILAMTAVGASVHKPGVYSGADGMHEVAKFRRLQQARSLTFVSCAPTALRN